MSTDDAIPLTPAPTPPLSTESGGVAGSPCPACGFLNAPGMRFCGNCGAALTVVAQPKATPPSPVAVPPSPGSDTPATASHAASSPAPVIAPSESVPKAVAAPRPAFNIPADAFARERERDRLLTLANVQRMRGQTDGAQNTLENALALMDDAPARDKAPVYEQLGDLFVSQSQWEEARTAFGAAHELDPARATAEKKFAQLTLRIEDEKALAKLGLGSRGEGIDAFAPPEEGPPRKPGLAAMSSVLLPGLGQFYNGENAKGAICVVLYLASLLFARLLPNSTLLLARFTQPLAGSAGAGKVAVSPLLWILLAISFAVWAYSVVDAAQTANKLGGADAKPKPKGAEPPIDKSGWEIPKF